MILGLRWTKVASSVSDSEQKSEGLKFFAGAFFMASSLPVGCCVVYRLYELLKDTTIKNPDFVLEICHYASLTPSLRMET